MTISYFFLLAIQVCGQVFLVWNALPSFRQLLFNPGVQLQYTPFEDNLIVGTLLVMQCAYWYRLLRVPIPQTSPKLFLSHLFLFAGRLSFIFAAAIFSAVIFRHLPELTLDIDTPYTVRRGILFCVSLFTLFCVTLELERFGNALGGAGSSRA